MCSARENNPESGKARESRQRLETTEPHDPETTRTGHLETGTTPGGENKGDAAKNRRENRRGATRYKRGTEHQAERSLGLSEETAPTQKGGSIRGANESPSRSDLQRPEAMSQQTS